MKQKKKKCKVKLITMKIILVRLKNKKFNWNSKWCKNKKLRKCNFIVNHLDTKKCTMMISDLFPKNLKPHLETIWCRVHNQWKIFSLSLDMDILNLLLNNNLNCYQKVSNKQLSKMNMSLIMTTEKICLK